MALSPTQAARIYDVSKPTLYNDMDDGTISYELTDKGTRRLNPAELDRVYEKRKNPEEKSVNDTNGAGDTNLQSGEFVSASLLDKMLRQQKEQFEEQIEILKSALAEAQKIPLLIENSRKDDKDNLAEAWEQNIQILKEQVELERELKEKYLVRAKGLNKRKKELEETIKRLESRLEQANSRSSIFKIFSSSPEPVAKSA